MRLSREEENKVIFVHAFVIMKTDQMLLCAFTFEHFSIFLCLPCGAEEKRNYKRRLLVSDYSESTS